ncbi:P44/Msp2 family outer membrane protein [Ehrlichia ruminantium]|uniref:Map1-10 n=1 Tax=Ehrlichia ruminantium TaxID=779 RepID=Q4L0C9_EHRRU|nr:P44/Msp2 family outer membrane protein [Ehrlichia ruminantium]BBE10861.1 map1-10 [uncultured Ehrlichia sp.]AAV73815.1 Map1-10 [Ehrlichia ruminantium]KYW93872.1 P44/Msp2 family outer membrane protein [Ehrlichia ruminantium]QLK50951.1 P44/Msp2 family outer membrane protein [Ehrlichia ruminantium]QLK51873.1 P44/Msp2 family outer membrane protein [Ehrlichia ruminantium]
MNNKNSITKVYIVTILSFILLPIQSFSALIGNITKNEEYSNVYITSQFKPTVLYFKDFSLKEINASHKSNDDIITQHDTKFHNNTSSFSGSVGYSSLGLRLELEGSHEKFQMQNSDIISKISKYQYSTKAYAATTDNYTNTNNNNITLTSLMVNTCYDITIGNSSAVPYLCTGIGGDIINIFNATHLRFAYQGKIGISYQLNNNFFLFADTYYHKIMGNKFKDLYIHNSSNITPMLAKIDIGYFGSEVGLRIIFNKL